MHLWLLIKCLNMTSIFFLSQCKHRFLKFLEINHTLPPLTVSLCRITRVVRHKANLNMHKLNFSTVPSSYKRVKPVMIPVRVYVFSEVCECLEKRVAEHYILMLRDRGAFFSSCFNSWLKTVSFALSMFYILAHMLTSH